MQSVQKTSLLSNVAMADFHTDAAMQLEYADGDVAREAEISDYYDSDDFYILKGTLGQKVSLVYGSKGSELVTARWTMRPSMHAWVRDR